MYFIAPLLAAFLMKINPWVPYLTATAVMFLALCVAFTVPETLGYHHSSLSDSNNTPRSSTVPNSAHDLRTPNSARTPRFLRTPKSATASRSTPHLSLRHRLSASTSFLTTDKRIPFLIIPLAAHLTTAPLHSISLQYASTRYHLSLSTSTLLLSLQAAFKVAVLLALVPALAWALTSRLGLANQRADLWLARGSLLVQALGWVAVGIAPGVVGFVAAMLVMTIGSAGPVLVRSLVTGLVRREEVGKLYAGIAVIETLVLMVGGPLMAGLFKEGLRVGGPFMGLPFWVVGVLNVGCVLFLFWVRGLKGSERKA